ncbi:hypothetical protein ACTXT7_001837 [Hymenolepis weldensis]
MEGQSFYSSSQVGVLLVGPSSVAVVGFLRDWYMQTKGSLGFAVIDGGALYLCHDQYRHCQAFTTDRIPKIIASSNITQFSSTLFEDVCCDLNIYLSHSSPNLDGQVGQLVDVVKRQLSCHMGKRFLILSDLGPPRHLISVSTTGCAIANISILITQP